jgi:hypothetical protein
LLETFDSLTGWVAGTDVANLALNTGTVKQGSASLEWDKTGGTVATATVLKLLGCPVDIQALRLRLENPTVSCWWHHANFANVSSVAVRFVYQLDTAGAPAVYDTFSLSTLTGAAWNELSVALDSPTSSTGTPTAEHRTHCIGYQLAATMANAADTFADLLADALTIKVKTGTAPPSLLVFDSQRLLLPPVDRLSRRVEPSRVVNLAQSAAETILNGRKLSFQATMEQVRHVTTVGARVYGLEDALRLFELYAQENQGWSFSPDANAIVNTDLDGAAVAGDSDIDVTSAVDLAYLGTNGQDIRIGPNSSRQWDRARVVSISTNKLYLDRPLRFSHADEVKVRSVEFYPTCAMISDTCVDEAGESVTFNLSAVETD